MSAHDPKQTFVSNGRREQMWIKHSYTVGWKTLWFCPAAWSVEESDIRKL
jgi:hypothetical protein